MRTAIIRLPIQSGPAAFGWAAGIFVAAFVVALCSPIAAAAELPLLLEENFENGADRWEPTDAKAWRVEDQNGNKVYSLFGASQYKPTHRSPLNISLLKSPAVGDFELELRVQSTKKDYNHRDLCIFFGWRDADHFYYAHFGKKTDDHANQIFIVNGAPRLKVSTETTPGTPWDDEWHRVKVTRAGDEIKVYFDDMAKPAMIAKDATFATGRIGVGSFDDIGNFDDITLRGAKAEK